MHSWLSNFVLLLVAPFCFFTATASGVLLENSPTD